MSSRLYYLNLQKVSMYLSIAITAIDAGDAFENCHRAEQTTKVSELRDRIIQVLDMLGNMSVQEVPTSAIPEVPSMPPPSATVVPLPVEASLIDTTGHLLVSDQSRKRCASELEEHRTVKALKREPQDDLPLTMSIQEVTPIPSSGMSYNLPTITPITFPVIQPSQPPLAPASTSRPPSPSFAIPNSFNALKQQTPVTAAFPAFLPTTSIPPQAHTSSSVPLSNPVAASPFPTLHSSWSDSVVPTRHHHSLSAGSVPVPHTGLSLSQTAAVHPNVAFPPGPSPPALAQAPIVPSNGVVSSISHPVGRMYRSGSTSGLNFRNIYAQPYGDAASASRYAPKASGSSGKSGQSSWYMGSEPVNSSKRISHSSSTSHASPPSDDEDDDDSSDSEEESAGKLTNNHAVR